MEVKVELAVSILFLFFLTLGSANASVFYLNSTQANVTDVHWDASDEYSIYLDYLNIYDDGSGDCTDLRSCYVDDTNSGLVEYDYVKTNIFNNQNLQNVSWLRQWQSKRTFSGDYYTFSILYDNSTTRYSAVSQRGTVVDAWDDLQFWDYACMNSTVGYSSVTKLTEEYYFQSDIHDPNTLQCMFYFNNSDVGIFLMNMSVNGASGRQVNSSWYEVFFHNANTPAELGAVAVETAETITGSQEGVNVTLIGTNLTTFSSVAYPLSASDDDFYMNLTTGNYKFFGLQIYVTMFSYPTTYFRTFVRGSNYNKENYRSVSLPICDDIYIGNTQTDFYHSGGSWFRKCSGYVPTGNFTELSCNLDCLEYDDVYTYVEQNKTVMSVPVGASQLSYLTHASVFNRGDTYPYIFDAGTDLDNIYDIRVYTALDFESYNDSQKFGVYGRVGLSPTVGMSSRTTYFRGLEYIPIFDYNTPLGIFEPMYSVSLFPELLYPITNNWYINTWWAFSDVPLGVDCSTLSYPTNFPYVTPINSSTRHVTFYATWKNVSSVATECVEYEPICYPVAPENYTYSDEDIVCVGLSCFVLAESICDNDGVCDAIENIMTCPSDCKTATSSDAITIGVSSLATLVHNVLTSMGEQFGIGYDGAKFSIWAVVIIVVMIIAGTSSGNIMVGAVSGLLFMLLGVVVGWIPVWVGIILIVLTALLIGKTFAGWIRGGD